MRALREIGATVIKLDETGALTLAFDAPLVPATIGQRDATLPKSAAEEERELLFASEDDG